MAGINDPFTPGETYDPFAGVNPQMFAQIQDQLSAFMGNPQGRAALLSAGLALMQPPSFGDTGAGQIGRAIGAAGESATANQMMDIKERDITSKEDIRGARAVAAEAGASAALSRAETAATRAGAIGQGVDFKREQLRAQQERNMLNNRVRLSNMYQQYVAGVAKQNQNAQLLNQPQVPVKPMGDWIRENPILSEMGLMPAMPDATEPTTAAPSPLDDATTVPSFPPAPPKESRVAGKVYQTPKGPMKWTGTGWIPQ